VSKPAAVRNAVAGDMPELLRLLTAQKAEAGKLEELDLPKATTALRRAIAKDRSLLFVAPGFATRLNGFLLFGLVDQWWSQQPVMVELAFVPDAGHKRSAGVLALQDIRRQAKHYAKPTCRTAATPVAPKPQPSPQNGAATTPQPVVAGGSDKVALSDSKPPNRPTDGVDALLKALASRSRPEPTPAP
jgi:hypothetical protein